MAQIQVWYGKYTDSPIPSYKFLSCIYEKYKILSHILGHKENFKEYAMIKTMIFDHKILKIRQPKTIFEN